MVIGASKEEVKNGFFVCVARWAEGGVSLPNSLPGLIMLLMMFMLSGAAHIFTSLTSRAVGLGPRKFL
jgi:hypothetical protein